MPILRRSKILPARAGELFYMILDVESYPEFIPWCSRLVILDDRLHLARSDLDSLERGARNFDSCPFTAEVTAQFKIFSETYKSLIEARISESDTKQKTYLVDVKAVEGPFKYLVNEWKFTQQGETTQVDFFIDFAFQQGTIEKLLGLFFDKAADKIMRAFEKRAKDLKIIS